jgi:hypothetical protein
MNKYRYTGEWAPIEVLEKFSNWDYALDEEDIEGQDETTIKPQENQKEIDSTTCASVADIDLPSGERIHGIIVLVDKSILFVDFLFNEQWYRIEKRNDVWVTLYEEWLPIERRAPKIDMTDKRFFPMHVVSRLPVQGGKRIEIEIR